MAMYIVPVDLPVHVVGIPKIFYLSLLLHGEWMRTPLTNAGCEDPSANLREIS